MTFNCRLSCFDLLPSIEVVTAIIGGETLIYHQSASLLKITGIDSRGRHFGVFQRRAISVWWKIDKFSPSSFHPSLLAVYRFSRSIVCARGECQFLLYQIYVHIFGGVLSIFFFPRGLNIMHNQLQKEKMMFHSLIICCRPDMPAFLNQNCKVFIRLKEHWQFCLYFILISLSKMY